MDMANHTFCFEIIIKYTKNIPYRSKRGVFRDYKDIVT